MGLHSYVGDGLTQNMQINAYDLRGIHEGCRQVDLLETRSAHLCVAVCGSVWQCVVVSCRVLQIEYKSVRQLA